MSQVLKPTRRRQRLVWIVATAVVLAALAAGGWYGWLAYTPPTPPAVALDGVEPAVAQAIEAARAKVLRNGRTASAWGDLGKVLLAHEFDTSADACFAQAERFDANEPRWPYYRGLTRSTKCPSEALPFLRRAADLCDRYDRGNEVPRLLLAEMLVQIGADDAAAAQLDRVLSLDADNPRLQYDLGLLAQARGDDSNAARYLAAAAVSPYARQKASSVLAAVRQRQGDEVGAAEYSRQAAVLPKDQNWSDPYTDEYLNLQAVRVSRFALPERLTAEGRLNEALPILLDLAEDASDAKAQIAVGRVLYRLQRFDEAEHYFRAAVGLDEEQAEANYFLTLTLYAQGEQLEAQGDAGREVAAAKYREAAAYADRAVIYKPDYALAYLYRGMALKRLARRNDAIESFRQAVRCRPELVDAYLKLADALEEDGQKEEAITQLRRAEEVAPADDTRPREAQARLQGTGGKTR